MDFYGAEARETPRDGLTNQPAKQPPERIGPYNTSAGAIAAMQGVTDESNAETKTPAQPRVHRLYAPPAYGIGELISETTKAAPAQLDRLNVTTKERVDELKTALTTPGSGAEKDFFDSSRTLPVVPRNLAEVDGMIDVWLENGVIKPGQTILIRNSQLAPVGIIRRVTEDETGDDKIIYVQSNSSFVDPNESGIVHTRNIEKAGNSSNTPAARARERLIEALPRTAAQVTIKPEDYKTVALPQTFRDCDAITALGWEQHRGYPVRGREALWVSSSIVSNGHELLAQYAKGENSELFTLPPITIPIPPETETVTTIQMGDVPLPSPDFITKQLAGLRLPFDERATFPIHSADGKFIGFGVASAKQAENIVIVVSNNITAENARGYAFTISRNPHERKQVS